MNSIFKYIASFYLSRSVTLKRSSNKKWALISYIPEPFRIKKSTYLNSHQNRRESLRIADVFLKNGYNVKIVRFDNRNLHLKNKYDLIFGIEPNFLKACKKNKDALKIYYATGSYFKFQNKKIIERTNAINSKNKINLKYSRLVDPHESCEIANFIVQIGSQFTISTYPIEVQPKIKLIRQSCYSFKDFDITEKLIKTNQKKFLWFGSSGSVLKGVDLLIDSFKNRCDVELHLVGIIDPDFYAHFSKQIEEAPNIYYHGYCAIDSLSLKEIANECSFIIFPSASEGVPGSVINMMKLGLIPIVSEAASFNEIEEYGFLISELSINNIDQKIDLTQRISPKHLREKMLNVYNYSNKNFNLEVFSQDFEEALQNILSQTK